MAEPMGSRRANGNGLKTCLAEGVVVAWLPEFRLAIVRCADVNHPGVIHRGAPLRIFRFHLIAQSSAS